MSCSWTTNSEVEAGDVVDREVISEELARNLLDRYRTHGISQFPFVVLPANAPLDAVRKKSPFVFLAIVATMIYDDPLLQYQLGDELCQRAFQRVFTGTNKTLDLLQGLLVYTAWYCHFYRADRHQELLLSQLCVNLVHDLGIDKKKRQQSDRHTLYRPVIALPQESSIANTQMRALLGTYCISCL